MMPACRQTGNPHVTDYYNIVFVYSNTCGFHRFSFKGKKIKLLKKNEDLNTAVSLHANYFFQNRKFT